jgi:hypothetical protein
MHRVWMIGALAALAGCDTLTPANLEYANLLAETRSDVREAFYEVPFSEGPISVVVTENGRLHTYALGPCAQRICGGTGRSGTVERSREFWIVRGAYAGRDFYLRPGGDGAMRRAGQDYPLAWD